MQVRDYYIPRRHQSRNIRPLFSFLSSFSYSFRVHVQKLYFGNVGAIGGILIAAGTCQTSVQLFSDTLDAGEAELLQHLEHIMVSVFVFLTAEDPPPHRTAFFVLCQQRRIDADVY